MEIGGCDIIFRYDGGYGQFIKDMVEVCRKHWPAMVVEFDTDNTFYVYRSREAFLRWEGGDELVKWWKGDEVGEYDGDEQMICFILTEGRCGTMVTDCDWKDKSEALIVADVKGRWLPCRFDHNGECLDCDRWPSECSCDPNPDSDTVV